MQFEKFVIFLAMEGYGIYVWSALLITLVSMLGYLVYLRQAHKALEKRMAKKRNLTEVQDHDT